MIDSNNKHYLARKGLIDYSMGIIRDCKEFERLSTKVYYELSKYGMNLKATKEGLFDEVLWSRKENIPQIFELVEAFLWRQIK